MPATRYIVTAAVSAIVLFLALAIATRGQKTSAETVVVTIQQGVFLPSAAIVPVGSSVIFSNKDTQDHWPASNVHPIHDAYPDFDPKRPIKPGGQWSFVFKDVGTWYFHDHLSPEIGGKIVVQGPSATAREGRQDSKKLMDAVIGEKDARKRQRLVRRLAYSAGPDQAITFLAEKLTKDGETHLLAHIVGEVAYDLSKEDSLPRCRNDMFNGCTHGLFLTAAPDVGFDGLRVMVKRCKMHSEFQYQMCIHGAGHAFLTLTSYDIMPAIANCDKLVDPEDPDIIHCYNGVFMENVLGSHDDLIPPLHPHLSTADLLRPCRTVAPRYRKACYFNQASWWSWVFDGDHKKTAEQCAAVPEPYRRECADSVGRVIASSQTAPSVRVDACRYLPPLLNDVCVTSMAKSVFAIGAADDAFVFCNAVSRPAEKERCWRELVDLFDAQNVTEETRQQYCDQFDPSYQYLCRAR